MLEISLHYGPLSLLANLQTLGLQIGYATPTNSIFQFAHFSISYEFTTKKAWILGVRDQNLNLSLGRDG